VTLRSLKQIIPSEPTPDWKSLSWKQKGLVLLAFLFLLWIAVEAIFATIEARENARLKEICTNPEAHSCYDLQYVMDYCSKAYYEFIGDGCTYQQINRSWLWKINSKKVLVEPQDKMKGVNVCVNLSYRQ
jgi:hypothetical protein